MSLYSWIRDRFEPPDVPFAIGWDEWDEYYTAARKKHPVRFRIWHDLDLFLSRWWRRLIHEPWYWLKCRLWHQYNVVRIKSLPPTWCDRDEVLLHACFTVFCDFVEREHPAEFSQTEEWFREVYEAGPVTEERLKVRRTMLEIYCWWQKWKDRDEDAVSDADQWAEENKRLHQLIFVRKSMWT